LYNVLLIINKTTKIQKDSNPCLEDPDFLSLAKKGDREIGKTPAAVAKQQTELSDQY
jgi:hypothetical protein